MMTMLKTILNQIAPTTTDAEAAATPVTEAADTAPASAPVTETTAPEADAATASAESSAQAGAEVAAQAPAPVDTVSAVNQAANEATAQVAEQLAQQQPSFLQFIEQSDIVGKSLFVILCIMSLITWYLIFAKGLANALQTRRSNAFLKRFWNAKSLDEVATELNTKGYNNPFSRLAFHAMKANHYHHQYAQSRLSEVGTGADFTIRNMRRVINEETARMESGLTIMSSIAATSPFVGLFGTVWGVYHALINIGMSDGVNINEVAGPVGEALIMTGLGLAVAIPAVLALNAFVRRNRVILSRIDGFAHDVFAFVSTGTALNTAAKEIITTDTQIQAKEV